MGTRRTQNSLSPQVALVRRQIERWRKHRKIGYAMPEELWASVVALVPEHGISPVANALRVNYQTLRRRYEEAGQSREQFVEFSVAQVVHQESSMDEPCETVIELTAKNGSHLVVRQTSRKGADLTELMTSLWSKCR